MEDDEDEDFNKFPAIVNLIPRIREHNPHVATKKIGAALLKANAEERADSTTQGFNDKDPVERRLAVFFNIAGKVRASCDMMTSLHKLFKEYAWELTKAIEPEAQSVAQGRLDAVKKRGKQETSGVKKIMDEMKKHLEEQKEADDKKCKEQGDDPEEEGWSTPYRVMYNCYWSLHKSWRDVNKKYNDEQAQCERRRRRDLIRQLTIASGEEPSEEEIQERLASNATTVFSSAMVVRSADEEFAAEYLQEAQEQNDAVAMVLEKMAELQELWDQFELLLQKQGELLDQIGANLDKCKDHVDQANEDLDSAIEHQNAALQKQFMIIGVCMIMIGILLVPVLLF